MPFKSQAQRRFMYSQKSELAKKFEKNTPKNQKLPEKVNESNLIKRINTVLADDQQLSVKNIQSRLRFEHNLDSALELLPNKIITFSKNTIKVKP